MLPILHNSPGIRASAVFYELLRNNPELSPGVRRTLERRIRAWRAKFGPDKEVIFRQNKEAGHLGISDFTKMRDLKVTIKRKQFAHMLYQFLCCQQHKCCYVANSIMLRSMRNSLQELGGDGNFAT